MIEDRSLTQEEHKEERADIQKHWNYIIVRSIGKTKLSSQMEKLIIRTLRQLSRLEELDKKQ